MPHINDLKVRDVDPQKFNEALSEHLKRTGKLETPVWVDLVKTGHGKELAPMDPGWFYVRAGKDAISFERVPVFLLNFLTNCITASIVRYIYINGVVNIKSLARKYSTRKNRGSRPHRSTPASRSVIRKALQALQKLGMIERVHGEGCRISLSGRKDLDR